MRTVNNAIDQNEATAALCKDLEIDNIDSLDGVKLFTIYKNDIEKEPEENVTEGASSVETLGK